MRIGSYSGSPKVESFRVDALSACGVTTCTVARSSGDTTCLITGVLSGMQFVVEVFACLPDALGCGPPFKVTTYTMPAREYLKYTFPNWLKFR